MAEPCRGTYTVLVTPFSADGAQVDIGDWPAWQAMLGRIAA